MTDNKKPSINVTVNIVGIEDATQCVELLCEKLKEAKSLAGDLASIVESLEVNIHG